jgi:hypothetical protein
MVVIVYGSGHGQGPKGNPNDALILRKKDPYFTNIFLRRSTLVFARLGTVPSDLLGVLDAKPTYFGAVSWIAHVRKARVGLSEVIKVIMV